MLGVARLAVLEVLVERGPLGLLVLRREQVVERLVALDDQVGDVLLHLHHEVGKLARDGHRVHQDGLRKLSGFLDGGYRRTYQQTDPIRCSCHGPRLRAIVWLASAGRGSVPLEPCRRRSIWGFRVPPAR